MFGVNAHPPFLGWINSSQKCNINPEVSEGQSFAVSQHLAVHISHILSDAVARAVGLPLGTRGRGKSNNLNHHI